MQAERSWGTAVTLPDRNPYAAAPPPSEKRTGLPVGVWAALAGMVAVVAAAIVALGASEAMQPSGKADPDVCAGCGSRGTDSGPQPAPSQRPTPGPSPLEKTYATMPLVVSWGSRTSAESYIDGSIPDDGHGLMAFGRCDGGGRVLADISGKSFSFSLDLPCDGGWGRSDGFPMLGAGDKGPFPVRIRLVGTVSAWEFQVRRDEGTRHDE
ncbi:hypothetical protein [Catellatospora citrea]|uniref:Uncharacterized protein n=1 Tax=Catellatospora citrea TaxID=53366 RepID=A0A8J3KJ52_9ACTN|nr:hypothetical protein [Catellatospora citrea]RKE10819.1 hypothetical protein C8E86_5738 [Catellatospora citrea]GIG00943.1 hypothetical protein Cci01nite_60360 [Catellatospora citrea]